LGAATFTGVCLVALTIWSLVFFGCSTPGRSAHLWPLWCSRRCKVPRWPQAALFAELFETHVRYSGISLAYQAGSILEVELPIPGDRPLTTSG